MDVFISALYHFSRWFFFGLSELWVVSGKSNARLAIPLHVFEKMDTNAVDVLPAVHALTANEQSLHKTVSSADNCSIFVHLNVRGYDFIS